MAYGDIILATKYNSIKNKVDRIITAGSGSEGYNGSSTTTAVKGPSEGTSPTDTITELQWDHLRNDITKCYRHQNGISPTITDVYQGLDIQWAHAVQYDVLADGIITNKDSIYTGGTGGGYTQQAIVSSGSGVTQTGNWNTNKTCTFTVDFGSAENARLFYNLGGYVKVVVTHTAGVANEKSGSWASIIDNMMAGNPVMTASGYRNLTNFSGTYTDTTAAYTDNNATLTMNWRADHYSFDVTITLNDTSGQPNAPWGTDENVGIDITANYEYRTSTGEFTSSGPSVSTPTWA